MVVWSQRSELGRVPALLLQMVVATEQASKSLNVADILENQRQPAPPQTVERKGMGASVRIFGVKSTTRSLIVPTRHTILRPILSQAGRCSQSAEEGKKNRLPDILRWYKRDLLVACPKICKTNKTWETLSLWTRQDPREWEGGKGREGTETKGVSDK